jgi:hypothetical protein
LGRPIQSGKCWATRIFFFLFFQMYLDNWVPHLWKRVLTNRT